MTTPTPRAPIYPVKGSELQAGMQTFIRVIVNGQVTFRKDCYLMRKIENTGACRNGAHFMVPSRTKNPRLVCYWLGATVFVRVVESAERSEAEMAAEEEAFHNLPDTPVETMPVNSPRKPKRKKASK